MFSKFPPDPYNTETETETPKLTQTEIYCLRMHPWTGLTVEC